MIQTLNELLVERSKILNELEKYKVLKRKLKHLDETIKYKYDPGAFIAWRWDDVLCIRIDKVSIIDYEELVSEELKQFNIIYKFCDVMINNIPNHIIEKMGEIEYEIYSQHLKYQVDEESILYKLSFVRGKISVRFSSDDFKQALLPKVKSALSNAQAVEFYLFFTLNPQSGDHMKNNQESFEVTLDQLSEKESEPAKLISEIIMIRKQLKQATLLKRKLAQNTEKLTFINEGIQLTLDEDKNELIAEIKEDATVTNWENLRGLPITVYFYNSPKVRDIIPESAYKDFVRVNMCICEKDPGYYLDVVKNIKSALSIRALLGKEYLNTACKKIIDNIDENIEEVEFSRANPEIIEYFLERNFKNLKRFYPHRGWIIKNVDDIEKIPKNVTSARLSVIDDEALVVEIINKFKKDNFDKLVINIIVDESQLQTCSNLAKACGPSGSTAKAKSALKKLGVKDTKNVTVLTNYSLYDYMTPTRN